MSNRARKTLFFIMLFIFIGIVAFTGFMLYRSRQEKLKLRADAKAAAEADMTVTQFEEKYLK